MNLLRRIFLLPLLIFPSIIYSQEDSLVWSDEFNKPILNTETWNYEVGTGINGNWGTGQLDIATERPENVHIESNVAGADSGALRITTQKESFSLPGHGTRNYTSGRINTAGKKSWGPGHKIVARVWARDVKYQGQGFAFWMMPDEVPNGHDFIMWPQGGEIDIMEYVGAVPYANLGSVHYAAAWLNNTFNAGNHRHQGFYYSYADKQIAPPAPQWIAVGLGEVVEISKVILRWEAAYAKGYTIQVSDDNQNWTDVFTTTSGDGGVDEIASLEHQGRYIRVLASERGTAWGYSLYEMEVYGSTQTNLALNASVSSSSNENNELLPEKAVDGNLTTRWASGSVEAPIVDWPVADDDNRAGSYSFHEYGIDWYRDRIEFFVDSNVYHIHYFNDGDGLSSDGADQKQTKTINGKKVGISEYSNHFNEWHPFENNMYIILSAGVGGNGTYGGSIVPDAQFPCDVFIDWIRVYSNGDAPPVVLSTSAEHGRKIEAYPNPACNEIHFKHYQEGSFQLFDQTGKYFGTKPVVNSAADLLDIPSGMYFLKIEGVKDNAYLKIIKTNHNID